MDELSRLFFQFWNQFCPAYIENAAYKVDPNSGKLIPAVFPYLTFSIMRLPFGEQSITGVNIYDQSNSFARIREIGRSIENAIPHNGIVALDMPNNGGNVLLSRGNPFIQSRSLPEDEIRANIKSDYVSVIIRSYIL
jgi:hypothetical protein